MSHGIRGHVHGTEGDHGSINTVMYDMRCEIPKYIPMVSHGITCVFSYDDKFGSKTTLFSFDNHQTCNRIC